MSDEDGAKAGLELVWDFHDAGFWIGVDNMLAPFRETVKV
jgi:hypothetical protein